MEEKKDYFAEGLEITERETILTNLKNTKFVDLAFALGYEKACLLKDNKIQKGIELINKIDTDIILAVLEDITHLIQYLKGNKDDVYVKQKIITGVAELNNYCAEVLNESGNN